MNILIVDDEEGIREGLATFLRLKGHRVTTAADEETAHAAIDEDDFDAVVTDWQLAPGRTAESIVRRLETTACLVASGYPESVRDVLPDAEVLTKPVLPMVLEEQLAAVCRRAPSEPVAAAQAAAPAARNPASGPLPADARDRLNLIERICGAIHEVTDDGTFVTVNAPLPERRRLASIERIVGDVRVRELADGAMAVELRFYRDGRPGDDEPVGAFQPWPEKDGALVIDLDKTPALDAEEFDSLLARAAKAQRGGRHVTLLNVPSALRLYAETSTAGRELSMRQRPGPRIPAVLCELWS